ncbi:MAG: glycosyltransferase family 39 protein [Candidatus Roizmanbacteria bacterium]
MKYLTLQKKGYILLGLILIIATWFRFTNLNWDENFHLHPDERFLTMVGNAMKVPPTVSNYLDPAVSTLNPANLNYTFFVYGTFPLIMNKLIALSTGNDNYNGFTLQGRFLSALLDLLVVIFIYGIVKLLEKKYSYHPSLKYWSAFLYAIAVTPIQLSHFFAVDTFMNTSLVISFYFALRYSIHKKIINVPLSGIFFGLALASKISAILMIPIIGFVLVADLIRWKFDTKMILQRIIILIILFGLVSYIALRLGSPYYFDSSNIFQITPNKLFMENVKQLSSWNNAEVWFPPAVQWITKPITFITTNLALYGVGIPFFIFILVGILYISFRIRSYELILLVIWSVVLYTYQSVQFVKAQRYIFQLYPYFAIFAGIGATYLFAGLHKNERGLLELLKKKYQYYFPAIFTICIVSLLVWPLSFMSIYINRNSRVEASEWIVDTFPTNTFIATEHWDDPLPLQVRNPRGIIVTGEQVPVFGMDEPGKYIEMERIFNKSQYYILSSNRAWASIQSAPKKFPQMSIFYKDLFAGKKQFIIEKEFTSYPSLKWLGIPIEFNTDGADETFTVYDHPKVIVMKKK